MTFSNDPAFVRPVVAMMMGSREAVVDYMTPLGLHHQMARDSHYGPGPWVSGGPRPTGPRPTTTAPMRTASASIVPPAAATPSRNTRRRSLRDSAASSSTPENLLLWFHHLPWDYRLPSGASLWDELVPALLARRGLRGRDAPKLGETGFVRRCRALRASGAFLAIQQHEAQWWRDASIAYFQTFSQRPFPADCESPQGSLAAFMAIHKSHVPGI